MKSELIRVRPDRVPESEDLLSLGKLLADSGLSPDTHDVVRAVVKVPADVAEVQVRVGGDVHRRHQGPCHAQREPHRRGSRYG